jgi:hypothetical protein
MIPPGWGAASAARAVAVEDDARAESDRAVTGLV